MLLDAERSVLLIVDVQHRLLPAIHDGSRVLENCLWLLRVAQRLQVPVLASEHYPRGLGPIVPSVRELLPADAIFEKVCFSCVADGVLAQRPIYGREQWVIAGTEAHVCVLQTALDLAAAGKRVFVAADAVGSRDPRNRDLALARMGQQGAQIVSREMVAFEWLRRAGSDRFREINRDFIR